MTDWVFHKIFLITYTSFRLRKRQQTTVLRLNLWKLPHRRYSPAKHHVPEVHLIGYASNFKKQKSNLSSKLISRSEKLTSEHCKELRPGSNCSQVWHFDKLYTRDFEDFVDWQSCYNNVWAHTISPVVYAFSVLYIKGSTETRKF